METTDTRHKSRTILDGRNRAPARSYLKGMGFTEEDLSRPIVGVAHSWIETMPCNFNHRHLAEKDRGHVPPRRRRHPGGRRVDDQQRGADQEP